MSSYQAIIGRIVFDKGPLKTSQDHALRKPYDLRRTHRFARAPRSIRGFFLDSDSS